MTGIMLCLGPDFANSNRPGKGKSLPTLLDDYVSIDIETTGIDTHFDEIIELGAARVSGGQIIDKFQMLVHPEQEIVPRITDLTKITNEMVADAPDISFALPQFRAFVGDSPILAHNANFDIKFLYDFSRLLELPVFSNDFIDTLLFSKRVFPRWDNHKLETLVQRLNIAQTVEHRALSDCVNAHLCYVAMKELVREHNICLSAPQTAHSHRALQRSPAPQITKITPQDPSSIDPTHPLFKKKLAFTGELTIPRETAMQMAVDVGAIVRSGVSKMVDYLIVGIQNKDIVGADGLSSKQKRAIELNASGQGHIEILDEAGFIALVRKEAVVCGDK